MRTKKSRNARNQNKPKGMGLIEIIVAIGISVITLTTAVSLSVRISIRAQENFVETSVLQYQSLVSEELRLLEEGLKKEVLLGKLTTTGTYLPSASTANITWAQFCGTNSVDKYMSISLPSYGVPYALDTLKLSRITATPVSVKEAIDGLKEDGNFAFGPIKDSNNNAISYRFGSFNNTNMPMEVSLKKTVTPSTIFNGNPDFNNITIKSVIHYKLYNKDYYTKPQEIRMVYNSVCPKS